MMKKSIEFLQKKNLVFRSLKPIEPKTLGTRKKVEIYLGVDLKDYYSLVMVLEKKSRVLQKEANELMALHERIEQLNETKVTKKYLIIKAPLCSKAKTLLEANGWKVWEDINAAG